MTNVIISDTQDLAMLWEGKTQNSTYTQCIQHGLLCCDQSDQIESLLRLVIWNVPFVLVLTTMFDLCSLAHHFTFY
jgi:hypothetical protein